LFNYTQDKSPIILYNIIMTQQETIKKAYELAVRSLRKLYTIEGIMTGKNHFVDYWARDNVFACLGALEIGDDEIVRKTLNLHLNHQRKDGLLPFRVGDSRFFLVARTLGLNIRGKDKPCFREDKRLIESPTDQNSLIVILFREYLRKTRKISFLRANIEKLEKSILWHKTKNEDSDPLIEEDYYSTWADNVKKRGKVLYTNVCYCYATKCLSEMFLLLGDYKKSEYYEKKANNLKKYIFKIFWNSRYFIDWVGKKRYDYFSTDGNVLAIIWGITNPEQSRQIEITLENFGINRYVPSLTNVPKYPSRVASSILLRLVGMSDYHNGLCWLWLGAADAIAKNKVGMRGEAIENLATIAKIALDYGSFCEIYEKKGKPVHRFFYKSEKDFAWSIGTFIWAYHQIYK